MSPEGQKFCHRDRRAWRREKRVGFNTRPLSFSNFYSTLPPQLLPRFIRRKTVRKTFFYFLMQRSACIQYVIYINSLLGKERFGDVRGGFRKKKPPRFCIPTFNEHPLVNYYQLTTRTWNMYNKWTGKEKGSTRKVNGRIINHFVVVVVVVA